MQIKRRLNAAAKGITPEVEASNTGIELERLTTRIEELVAYAESKIERAKYAEKHGPFAARITNAKDAEIEANRRAQEASEAENLADQQQQKAQPDVEYEGVTIDDPVQDEMNQRADAEADASRAG